MFTKVSENLRKLGYKVCSFESCREANEYIKESVKGKSVGIGGSMTVKEMGLYDEITDVAQVYWHWSKPSDGCPAELTKKASEADIYITSANALSENGYIINIDGNCNRVSSSLYGHEKVFFVIGKNKLADTLDNALNRARNVAAPKNALRLNVNTPCVKSGRCHDCSSPDRICRALCVLWTKPGSSEYEVILINQNLGY